MIILATPILVGSINRIAVVDIEPHPDVAFVTVQPILDSGATAGERYRLKVRNGTCDGLRRRPSKRGEEDVPPPERLREVIETFEVEAAQGLARLLRGWHSGESRAAALENVERAGLRDGWLDSSITGAVI